MWISKFLCLIFAVMLGALHYINILCSIVLDNFLLNFRNVSILNYILLYGLTGNSQHHYL